MRLSWSHKLFFLANQHIGRSALFDRIVVFFAKDAIVIMGLAVILVFSLLIHSWLGFFYLLMGPFVGPAVLAFAVSWLFGWLYPHRRPIIEFPEVKEIIKPLSHWKSLPSDHAIMAALLAYFVVSLPVSPVISTIFFMWAILISVARVSAGVHYPRDIVAGWILATVVAFIFWR